MLKITQTRNEWLLMNRPRIEGMKRLLTEMSFKNEYEAVPLKQIIQMIEASSIEIMKLQKEIDELKKPKDEVA